LCGLSPCRRHAETKGGVGAAAMCELPRANLGGKEVAGHFRENLQPLHKARRIKKSEWNALALRGV